MKINRAERWVVSNPLHVFKQRLEVRWVKRTASLGKGAKVLDAGCGRGSGARLLLEEFDLSFLHAMDLDMEMLRRAKKYLSSRERERISLCLGDISGLPFASGSLDAVFGFGVLHHAIDWRGALGEIARVLKPGGIYFMEEFYPPLYQNLITRRILAHPQNDRFSSHDLRSALQAIGLPVTDALEIKQAGILALALKEK